MDVLPFLIVNVLKFSQGFKLGFSISTKFTAGLLILTFSALQCGNTVTYLNLFLGMNSNLEIEFGQN